LRQRLAADLGREKPGLLMSEMTDNIRVAARDRASYLRGEDNGPVHADSESAMGIAQHGQPLGGGAEELCGLSVEGELDGRPGPLNAGQVSIGPVTGRERPAFTVRRKPFPTGRE
jgi:hypothetical protein